MKTKFLLFCLFSVMIIHAQKTSDKNDVKFEYQLGRGATFSTTDSLYRLNLRFRSQHGFDFRQGIPNQYRSGLGRTLLRLGGAIDKSKWGYLLQISLSDRDVKNGQLISDAFISYHFNPQWNIGFGKTKLSGNRQRTNSSGALQFVTRTLNNSVYSLDKVYAFHLNHFKEKYSIRNAISFGGNSISDSQDNGIAYTTRWEWYPFGRFKNSGEFFEGDLEREEKFKFYFGVTYHFHYKARKTQATRGASLQTPTDMHSYFVDALFKYKGWAGALAFMGREASDLQENQTNFVRAGYGIDGQLSYIFRNNWEIATRYSWNNPHLKIRHFVPKQSVCSFGVSKYIWGHSLKIQAEAGQQTDYFSSPKKSFQARVQLEITL